MKRLFNVIAIILSISLISGCELGDAIKQSAKNEVKDQSKKVINDFKTKRAEKNTSNINTEQEQSLIGIETNKENYAFVNNNKVTLNNEEKARLEKNGSDRFWVDYSNLDRLGRAGQVTALVTSQSVYNHSSKVQKRPSFDSDVHIAGEYKDGIYNPFKQTWKGNQSNNQITQLVGYRGYLYNKSHLLAWSLGGNMETHNLVLGTRSQNVGSNKDVNGGGMGYPETQVRNAIYDNPDIKVFYKVTPVYNNKELLPRGTHVKAYSVNDNGKTVNINVWIANKQQGININYKDGTFQKVS
ncbi:DNA/RNA non-specific endonuclease [Staphylococcus aureus]|nr:DNA/RNA non-specific endonuclease [Staphylococcus aureus]MBS3384731.1 DNA/RNA non-specific endonuclease [Staphylococcus aureus]